MTSLDDAEFSAWDAAFVAACQHAAQFFVPSVAEVVRRLVPGNYGVAEAVWHVIISRAYNDKNLDVAPSSVLDFVRATEDIFSAQLHETLIDRAIAFNEVSGLQKAGYAVSDIFIREYSTLKWMALITNFVAAHCEEVVAVQKNATGAAPDVPTPRPGTSTTAAQQTTTGAAPVRPGASTVAAGSSTTTTPSSCPIVQIELEGSTILEAWMGNSRMQELEREASERVESFDPSRGSCLPVYHGTPFPPAAYNLHLPSHRQSNLHGSVSRNQVAPASECLPVLWTGFSPLRCFLWAVFRADVIPNGVIHHIPEPLAKTWKCEEHGGHKGVGLLKFYPLQPAPPGLSWYIIPRGQEPAWTERCQAWTEPDALFVDPPITRETVWDFFRDFHGGNPATWPHVLHCREFGDQRRLLSDFTQQLWRTVWAGEGIQRLNESHEITFAISFMPTAPTETPNPPANLGQAQEKKGSIAKRA